MTILKSFNYCGIKYPSFTLAFDRYNHTLNINFENDNIKHGSRTKLRNHLGDIVSKIFVGTVISNEHAFLDQVKHTITMELQRLYECGILKFDPIYQEFFLLNEYTK